MALNLNSLTLEHFSIALIQLNITIHILDYVDMIASLNFATQICELHIPCCTTYQAFKLILTLPSCSRNQDSTVRVHELVSMVASDYCSWQTGIKPDLVICCCSSSFPLKFDVFWFLMQFRVLKYFILSYLVCDNNYICLCCNMQITCIA